MYEIDTRNADFDDIEKFARNLLGVSAPKGSPDYETMIAYLSTMTQVLIARRTVASADKLAHEIDAARVGVAKGLDKLTLTINDASNQSSIAAQRAETQARRMVRATWGLVVATAFLGLATVGLVYFTYRLASTPPTVITAPAVAPRP